MRCIQKENLDKLLKDADKKLGGIDIFYANAGFAYYEVIPNADWDRIARIYSTNVFSPFYCLIALNQTRKEPFLFVVTASAMSHLSLPGYALYSSTKAAVRSFIDAFRFELKPGNRVMVVYPIATRTQFFDAAGKKYRFRFQANLLKRLPKK